MGLHKFCKCGVSIPYSKKYCSQCEEQVKTYNKSRNYKNKKRADDKESQFYNTQEWRKLRNKIVKSYMSMDVYEYYKTGKIVSSEVVHHLVEVRSDWSKRLDKFNLIPVTRKNHQEIHLRMEVYSEEVVRKELEDMLKKFREEFGVELS